ncbi:hypothetical protein K501DRAFT_178648 [Backusella circina FSU 941]|nr:hypothetical protein K501DRAFT_178648 [Backusella circina FSU 941]
MKDYLPTPVTPASDFPRLHNNDKDVKKETSSYSTFSVLKPVPQHNSNRDSATLQSPSSDSKPYPCPECHQTFSRPHNLKSHLTTHSSERPFQCDVCKHHFRRHHDLKRHQKLHTGERPYVCKNCYRSFARLDALNRHRRAEGGTACSVVHQQKQQQQQRQQQHHQRNHSQEDSQTSPTLEQQQQNSLSQTPNPQQHSQDLSSGSDATYHIGGGLPSLSRPVIPQLHIAHPASQPYPKNNYPHPSLIPATHSPPQQQLLPSPSAFSILPVAEHKNLSPIYKAKSLPSTPSSPPTNNSMSHYHSYQWSPYPRYDRPTLPPLASPTPATTPTVNQDQPVLDRIQQENEELKRDINQLRAMAQKETTQLKSRLHDLEVENKVLRSLIHSPGDESSQSKDVDMIRDEK